jgi:HTH-type transcriptional regulator, glycine betaine synthesis regulator
MAHSLTFEAKERPGTDSLRAIQGEMASIFADLSELFGNPSSLGSIYGLLFASPEPLSMEEIVERLGVSNGTASQGLRRLVELQAVLSHKEEGERVTRYTAKLELRPFVLIFLKERLMPRLEQSSSRLVALEEDLAELSEQHRTLLKARLGRASKWHRRAKTFIPIIRRFLA